MKLEHKSLIFLFLLFGNILIQCNPVANKEAEKIELELLDKEIEETEKLLAMQKHKMHLLKLQSDIVRNIEEETEVASIARVEEPPVIPFRQTVPDTQPLARSRPLFVYKPRLPHIPSPAKLIGNLKKGIKEHIPRLPKTTPDPVIQAFNAEGSDSKQNITMNLKHIIKTDAQITAMTEFYHHVTNTEYLIVALNNGADTHFNIIDLRKGALVMEYNVSEYHPSYEDESPIPRFTISEMFANIKRQQGDILLVGRTHDGRVLGWSILPHGNIFDFHFEFQLDVDAVTKLQSYPAFEKQMIITGDSFGELKFFNTNGQLIRQMQTSHNHISVMARKRNQLAFGSGHVISFLDLSMKPEQMKLSEMDKVKCVGGSTSPFVELVYDINRNSNIMFALNDNGEIDMFDTHAYFKKKVLSLDGNEELKPSTTSKSGVAVECRLLHTIPSQISGRVAMLPKDAIYIPGHLPLTYNRIRVPLSDYKKVDIHASLGYLHVVDTDTWSTYATGNTKKGPVLVFQKD